MARSSFDIAPRAFFEVGRRNLFGKNRSINLFTQRQPAPAGASRAAGTADLTEYRVLGTFREPRLFDTPADGFVNGDHRAAAPIELRFRAGAASVRTSQRVNRAVSVTAAYQMQRTELCVKVRTDDPNFPLIDRAFPTVAAVVVFVLADSRHAQRRGRPDVGRLPERQRSDRGRAIGSQVGFVKSFITAQMFRAVPRSSGIVLAGSARLGPGHTGSQASRTRSPRAERFFAGGDTTDRGFALDPLGVRHEPPPARATRSSQNGFPIGGNGLVIFNGELRVPVRGGLGVVGFFDTGNVFAMISRHRCSRSATRSAVGMRYRSPFGPLRIDLGIKVEPACPGEMRASRVRELRQALLIQLRTGV